MRALTSPVTRATGCVRTLQITQHVSLRAEFIGWGPIAHIQSAAYHHFLQDCLAVQCPQTAWGDLQVEWMFKQPATLELTHNWCAAPNL